MRNRLLLLFGVLALLLAGAGLVAVWFRPMSPINRANYERIRRGMTEAEVEQLLGGPAGDYTTGRGGLLIKLPTSWPVEEAKGATERLWISDEGVALVFFDEAGRVKVAYFRDAERLEPSLLEKVHAWLGL